MGIRKVLSDVYVLGIDEQHLPETYYINHLFPEDYGISSSII